MKAFDPYRLGSNEDRKIMEILAHVCEVAITNYVIDNAMRYPAECVDRMANEVTIDFHEHGSFKITVEKI